MKPLRVWAPAPKSVAVRVNGRDTPMQPSGRGWWELPVEDGTAFDYQFVLDGQAVPDPRSPFQPHGIHGPSRRVDHDAFQWSDADWQAPALSSAVIYEMHVGTFTPEGTFEASIGKLEYLKSLGVTHVELMPVNEFSGSHGWGYDGVDLFAPHHRYGCPDSLKRFVDACHRKGLAAILDVVYNHLGPAGNYLGCFGPYFTERYSTPWGPAVNLDGAGSDAVRRFFCDNALMWLRDYHFDGLRLDAVHALLDTSATHLLEQLAGEVHDLAKELGRQLFLIAESDLNDPRVIRDYGVHAQWSDDFHHALHTALTGESKGYYADFRGLEDVARAIENTFVYAGEYSPLRDRQHGRKPVGIPQWRFLGYLQNHDQVGNRARGERSSHLMNTNRLMIGAALVLTAPFTPMLFQGEEWGASTPFLYFSSHEEQWLAEAVSKGRCEEFSAFGWKAEDVPDPQASETFEISRLNWDERDREPHADLLRWHRDLIRIRREYLDPEAAVPAHAQCDPRSQWLRIRNGRVITACNLASQPQQVPLPDAASLILASQQPLERSDDTITLAAESAAVLRAQ